MGRQHIRTHRMPRSNCRVSIVIPLYNSASTLPRAAGSVLRQTLQDFEILIVDDGSQDTSLAEAHAVAAADSRVHVIALPENRGKSYAMNHAITRANGTWVAVLDADDWYEPDRLATLVAAGEARNVSLVADNQRFWDAGAGTMVRTAFPNEQGDRALTRQLFIAGCNPYAAFDYGMLKPIIRADCIRRLTLAYHESARLSEDFLYLVDFFAAGETGWLTAQPLYNWTQSFGTISRQWTLTGAGDWRYDYRSALKAYADTLSVLLARNDLPLANLLTARMRAFERLDHLTTLNRMRSSGEGFPRILFEAARHPSIWPLVVSRLLRA
jgi:succinoglycan biosynthesis protein ExoO